MKKHMGRKRKEVDTSTYAGKLAVRLVELREKKKLTAAEVAEQTGISIRTIQNWENGDRCPITEDFLKLAKLYGIKSLKDLTLE